MSQFRFTLYVAGESPRSRQAIANLDRICREALENCYEVVVVDVVEQPDVAESQRILATPTLVKEDPPPLRRITGDLSDIDRVLIGLGLETDHKENRSEERA